MSKNKSEIKTIFDWWSKYLKVASPLVLGWIKKETQWIRKNVKGPTVLDVGCGWGDDLKTISNNIKSGVGIDREPKMIEEAKKNLGYSKNIKIFLGDVKKLRFKNNSFDYVLCLGNTFGNLDKNKIKALREMKRVLKNNGKIVISVYSEKAFPKRMESYKNINWPITKITKRGTVYEKSGIISEQFSKDKLKKIFTKAKLRFKIQELNPISYICIATRR